MEALRKQGFDRHGMPLLVKGGQDSRVLQRTSGPVGTIVVFCQEDILRANAEEVRTAGERIVRQAMQRFGLEWIEGEKGGGGVEHGS